MAAEEGRQIAYPVDFIHFLGWGGTPSAPVGQGLTKGKAEGILTILENRGIDLSSEQRETILTCLDLEQLDRRLRRSLTLSNAPELFD